MTVDLTYEELVLLLVLVNDDFCGKQRASGEPTPFESRLFNKLMEIKKESDKQPFLRV